MRVILKYSNCSLPDLRHTRTAFGIFMFLASLSKSNGVAMSIFARSVRCDHRRTPRLVRERIARAHQVYAKTVELDLGLVRGISLFRR